MAPKIVRRMNQRMETMLSTLAPGPVPSRIEAELRMGVAELGQYLLFRSEVEQRKAPPDPIPDATGVEASLNDLNVGEQGWGVRKCAQAGLTALDLLRQAIIEYPSSGPVQVVLGVGFHEIPSCTLRFYRRRVGETWIVDDLEGYETEAILVEDIR
jgi:hypothetical protein